MYRYNVRNLANKEWVKRDQKLQEAFTRETKTNTQTKKNKEELIQPEKCYREITRNIKSAFGDVLRKQTVNSFEDPADNFICVNKDHEKIPECMTAKKEGNLQKCSELQREIRRDGWRNFLDNTQAKDLRKIFQFFARADGRKPLGYIPARQDPLWGEENKKWCLRPKDKANLLGGFFKKKMTRKILGGELKAKKSKNRHEKHVP